MNTFVRVKSNKNDAKTSNIEKDIGIMRTKY